MAVLSKLRDLSLPYNCYEVGHTWTPHCSEAAVRIGVVCFLQSLKIYTPLYLLSQMFHRKFHIHAFLTTLQSVFTSSCFLSFNAFSFIFIFCLLRKIMGKFYYLHCSYLPAFMASFMAILIERRSRRGPLALYVTNVASETFYRMAVCRGKLKPVANGEIMVFSSATALLLYIIRKHGFTKDFISILIKYILGSEIVSKEKMSTERIVSETYQVKLVKKTVELKHMEDIHHVQRMKSFSNRHSLNGHMNMKYNSSFFSGILLYVRSLFQKDKYQNSGFMKMCGSPKHQSCPHALSCPLYIFEGVFRPLLIGWGAHFLVRLISSPQKVLIEPAYLAKLASNKQGLNLGFFMSGFSGTYRLVSCLMRWIRNADSEWHAIPAGLLAGCSMKFFPSSSLALYLFWKLVEVSYQLGMDSGLLPNISGSMVLLYAASTAVLFYAAVLEPHNLKPAYLKFLNQITSNRISQINRHVLDIFGTHASKLYPNFWPRLELNYTSRVFQESVLVWLIH